ncbi:MAG TPA: Rrf2 family transcriptional regulator [Azospirillaceae bacterium]|nr:Rrf2 family transcriptional regulator [Azospirillaceae bacterium]
MHLSSYSDYALRTLIFLALKGEGLATVAEISAAYGISKNHLMKIVHQLGQGGYVETVRGRGGGLRLARAPEAIRVGEVVRFTEQDMCIVECFGADAGPGGCRLAPSCVLKSALNEALRAFLGVLDEYTLADLVRPRRSLGALLALPAPAPVPEPA